jgi:hypothetical protein
MWGLTGPNYIVWSATTYGGGGRFSFNWLRRGRRPDLVLQVQIWSSMVAECDWWVARCRLPTALLLLTRVFCHGLTLLTYRSRCDPVLELVDAAVAAPEGRLRKCLYGERHGDGLLFICLDHEEQASGDPGVGGCFGKSISQPTLGMPDSGWSE